MTARSARVVALVAVAASLSVSGAQRIGVPSSLELVVEDVGRPRVLYRERVAPGATFTVEYRHSSEGVPVRGTFRADGPGGLTVVETAFGGFGPGLPRLTRGSDHWAIAGDMIVHRPPEQTIADLRLRVMSVSRPRLTTPSGQRLDLTALAGPRAPVVISVR